VQEQAVKARDDKLTQIEAMRTQLRARKAPPPQAPAAPAAESPLIGKYPDLADKISTAKQAGYSDEEIEAQIIKSRGGR
jgi:hypothetical protein